MRNDAKLYAIDALGQALWTFALPGEGVMTAPAVNDKEQSISSHLASPPEPQPGLKPEPEPGPGGGDGGGDPTGTGWWRRSGAGA